MKYWVTLEGRTFEVAVDGPHVVVDGRERRAVLTGVAGTPLRRLETEGRSATFALTRDGATWLAQRSGESWRVAVVDERTRALQRLTGRGGTAQWGGVVRAPMPGLVLRVDVAVGQRVEAGAGLVALEAMKMENEITAPGAGVVQAVRVRAGEAVEKGVVLVEIASEG